MKYILIGNSNVGKTSIFNILTSKNKNITHFESNTTKDWHKSKISRSEDFIYDTPGLNLISKDKINKKNILIIKNLISNIDTILFVVDHNDLFTINDQLILKKIRQLNKTCILIANKNDNKNQKIAEILKYRIDEYYFISCSHNTGFDNLKKFVFKINSKSKNIKISNNYDYILAIFGKPNAGKSTFMNSLLGYERSITDSKAGTTSDYVSENFIYKDLKFKIYDTAGIGRKSKIINQSISELSIKKTISKMHEIDFSIILIDSKKNFDRQDKRIIKLISQRSKYLAIIFNKIDLILDKKFYKNQIKLDIKNDLHQIKNIEIFFISSFIKTDVKKILKYIYLNLTSSNVNITTSIINKWLNEATKKYKHPLIDKKNVKFKYALKVKDSPITIKIFSNFNHKLNKNYIRYLKNNFNNYFKIKNQNINLVFNKSENPYN
ncbi:MAG: GTPase Der [Alphaproteobacteria bacterium MarineAlpha5_Bin9]|nr:MAG: GTPase Der [Alphaproteobacteria bacterium MarineAlpha5_Bin9]|tara:strand:+ start:40878 stop:42188 length:1311 start_codon:yes stop_codon:yes gene_type:complete